MAHSCLVAAPLPVTSHARTACTWPEYAACWIHHFLPTCPRRTSSRLRTSWTAGARGGRFRSSPHLPVLMADVPRRRAALSEVLFPGRLGVEVAIIGGDRCDRDAMASRLALARGGPLLALLDPRALADLVLPDDVHLVVVDPPVFDADIVSLRTAGAGRTVHLAWGEDEARYALGVAEADLSVRDVARGLWPSLKAASALMPWDSDLDHLLAGDGAVSRSPRAIAIALSASVLVLMHFYAMRCS